MSLICRSPRGVIVWRSRFAALALLSVVAGAGHVSLSKPALAGPLDPASPTSASATTDARTAPNTVVLSTEQSRFTPGVNNQGYWATGTDSFDANDNYVVGSTFIAAEHDHRYRSFFTFDVSNLSKQVESATFIGAMGVSAERSRTRSASHPL
jgi:hypothetical protein